VSKAKSPVDEEVVSFPVIPHCHTQRSLPDFYSVLISINTGSYRKTTINRARCQEEKGYHQKKSRKAASPPEGTYRL